MHLGDNKSLALIFKLTLKAKSCQVFHWSLVKDKYTCRGNTRQERAVSASKVCTEGSFLGYKSNSQAACFPSCINRCFKANAFFCCCFVDLGD